MSLEWPDWLQHRPLVERIRLELTPPRLGDNIADLDRLVRACKAKGYRPITWHPPDTDRLAAQVRNADYSVSAMVGFDGICWRLLDALAAAEVPLLGCAIDLGTTRLAFYLMDLLSGEVLEQTSVANPQIPYGEDILSRIVAARDPQVRHALQQGVITVINETVAQLCARRHLRAKDVYAVTIAGNTTMSHFLLDLEPANICKEPYIPVANRFPFHSGEMLQIDIHPQGLVYVFPNVGSYFGGDLIAGILATGMRRREELSILVDVGTNAEVVLGNREWLIACAGAAGPALEGGVVEKGMMAAPGAIDRIRIDPDTLEVTYHVLGDQKPIGICGSGLIDLVAEMFNAGALTIQGKINTDIDSPRIVETPDGPAFIVAFGEETADGEDLMVTQIDIGILLKSKAAMYTILNVICNKVGVSLEDLERFYVAGTFGNHIDPRMAIRIGMLPDLPPDIFAGLGNTSGKGAAMLLRDRTLLQDIEDVCTQITYIELNVNMELMNEFRGATFIPHTDPKRFPSVRIPERALGKGQLNGKIEGAKR